MGPPRNLMVFNYQVIMDEINFMIQSCELFLFLVVYRGNYAFIFHTGTSGTVTLVE